MTTDIQNTMVRWKEEYPICDDFFGNEVYEGDTILEYDNEIFLKSALSDDAITILSEICNAIERRPGMNLDLEAIKQFKEIRERLRKSGVRSLDMWKDSVLVNLNALHPFKDIKVEERIDPDFPYKVSTVADGIELHALATAEEVIKFFERRGKGETV